MILSKERILTTHVGSLPRNETLSDLLVRREDGEAIDKDQLAREMDLAVHRVVDKQAAAGIDIANDGKVLAHKASKPAVLSQNSATRGPRVGVS